MEADLPFVLRRVLRLCFALAAFSVLGGCASDDPAAEWGTNAETYFAE